MGRAFAFGAALLTLQPLVAPPARALQCRNGIVSEGDAKIAVLKACGEPAYSDSRQEERVSGKLARRSGVSVSRRSTVTIDEWTFNFGPQQFVYYVTFANGRVAKIERGEYGYDAQTVEESRSSWEGRECRAGGFRLGDHKFDVLMKCGQPVLKEQREEEHSIRVFDREKKTFSGHRASLSIEEWTYNFGPRRFVYFLRFEDGRLSEIETGGYGF